MTIRQYRIPDRGTVRIDEDVSDGPVVVGCFSKDHKYELYDAIARSYEGPAYDEFIRLNRDDRDSLAEFVAKWGFLDDEGPPYPPWLREPLEDYFRLQRKFVALTRVYNAACDNTGAEARKSISDYWLQYGSLIESSVRSGEMGVRIESIYLFKNRQTPPAGYALRLIAHELRIPRPLVAIDLPPWGLGFHPELFRLSQALQYTVACRLLEGKLTHRSCLYCRRAFIADRPNKLYCCAGHGAIFRVQRSRKGSR